MTPVATTAERVEQQRHLRRQRRKKRDLLVELFDDATMSRVHRLHPHQARRRQGGQVARRAGIDAAAIHGDKSQSQRERALAAFRAARRASLVATDIAARGIDIDGVTHVVNFELPDVAETYVHRIGRTARAGAAGRAISLCDDEERDLLRDIERLTRLELPKIDRRGALVRSLRRSCARRRSARRAPAAQRPHHSPHRDARSVGKPAARPHAGQRQRFRPTRRVER